MLWTALALGLAGSLHCMGMCGPLMLAFPLPLYDRLRAAGQALLYQAGRISTYALLGGLFGLLGKGVALAGLQQMLSIAAGAAMITAALFAWRWERTVLQLPGLSALTAWAQHKMGYILRQHPQGSAFSLGALNGLVPCGLVYAAVAGAISTTRGLDGALFMLLFGLGTVPLLLTMLLGGHRFAALLRGRFRWLQPAILLVAGALLLYRGMQLDLSLFQGAVPPADADCH
jgi:sulfite exporter TauE/SafE